MRENNVSRAVALLSGLSAWSLLLFGGLSLLAAIVGGALAEGVVGVALIAHGSVELRQRSAVIGQPSDRAWKWLAGNQIALSASVLSYLAWQVLALDWREIELVLAREPTRSLLAALPGEMAEMFRRDLPALILNAYGVAGIAVLIGCLGMAAMYLRARRRSVVS